MRAKNSTPTTRSEVTEGWEALDAMELLETTRDGIFVMPKKRVTIESTYTCVLGCVGGIGKACTTLRGDIDRPRHGSRLTGGRRKACLPPPSPRMTWAYWT